MAAPSANFVPYDDRDGWIWLDGQMVPWRDAKIHVLTHSLHYGSCVFEGERAYEGKVFRSTDHSKRLHKSAELVGYKCPVPVAELDRIKLEVMGRNGLSDCYIRAFSWRGSEMMGVSAQQASIRTCVAVWHWGNYFADKNKGIRVTMSDWKRPSPETIPSAAKAAGLYMICTMSKHKAEAEGFSDALMLDYRGYVAELTGANVFLDPRRRDPHADAGLLPQRPDAADRDRTRARARLRGDRASHHAGRALQLLRVLHHGFGGRSDAGRRDGGAPLQARQHHGHVGG
jgi:branched-subunit amino acid aminotransferase/4-amino-4-deoxychorismate lyase